MKHLTTSTKLTKREYLILLIPYLTAFTWYYLFSTQILVHVSERLGALEISLASVFFFFSIAFSILAGSFLVDKLQKVGLIFTWAAIMPLLMIPFIFTLNIANVLVLTSLSGALFGIGLLAYSVYFRNLTIPEERGRVSGTIVFLSFFIYPVVLLLAEKAGLFGAIVISVFLGACTFMIQLLKPEERSNETVVRRSYVVQSRRKRAILLYLVPWVVFCLINGMLAKAITMQVTPEFADVESKAFFLRYLTASFGAILGGFLADWIGRKFVINIGIMSFGISTVLSGLSFNPIMFVLAYVAVGFNWGIFLVVYLLIVWGDLASINTCAPLYAAGFVPFYFLIGLGDLIQRQILLIPSETAAFISSFLIFSSATLVIFAPELLPREKRKKMEFELYKEEVKKILKKWEDRASKEK